MARKKKQVEADTIEQSATEVVIPADDQEVKNDGLDKDTQEGILVEEVTEEPANVSEEITEELADTSEEVLEEEKPVDIINYVMEKVGTDGQSYPIGTFTLRFDGQSLFMMESTSSKSAQITKVGELKPEDAIPLICEKYWKQYGSNPRIKMRARKV